MEEKLKQLDENLRILYQKQNEEKDSNVFNIFNIFNKSSDEEMFLGNYEHLMKWTK